MPETPTTDEEAIAAVEEAMTSLNAALDAASALKIHWFIEQCSSHNLRRTCVSAHLHRVREIELVPEVDVTIGRGEVDGKVSEADA